MKLRKLEKEDLEEFAKALKEYKSCYEKQKIMITMNIKLLEELDKIAKEENKTRSATISEAVDLYVQMTLQMNMLKEKK